MPPAEAWAPILAAPFVGSLLGVLIVRLPAGRPVALARSHCESCGRVLAWWELPPLLAYALLRGRCRTCRAPIGRFHWHVEAAATALAAAIVGIDAAAGAAPAAAWADCAMGWALLALAWIDWRHQRLPDAISLPLLAGGLLATWLLDPAAILDHAIGAVAGWLAFRAIALAYQAWRGHAGLGAGDAKLLAAAGAWVGWQGLDQVVLLGALLSLAVALWQARGHVLHRTQVVPFGPGLAASMLAVRLHGGGGA